MELEKESLEIKEGKYFFSNANLLELAETYGTPLYVISKEKIERNIREFNSALQKYFMKANIVYASKALSLKELYRILNSENLYADVVSMGEILTAASVDFPFDRLFFHGNAKGFEDIKFAIENNIKFVVDNESEFYSVINLAKEINKKANILFRIKPGVEPQTHSYVKTGHKKSKFGMEINTVLPLVNEALSYNQIDFLGFHYHIGSQIFDLNSFKTSSEVVSLFLKEIFNKFKFLPKYLNVGGGFGVRYTDNDLIVEKSAFISSIREGLESSLRSSDIDSMTIFVEPGRAIVGDAGIVLYRVLRKKKVENKTYLFVDGGMGDNIRPALYGARYTVVNISKISKNNKEYAVFGKYCESGDVVSDSALLPETDEGDVLTLLTAGAYTYSMASNYNRFPRPAVVLVDRGNHKLIAKRETYQEVLKNDL